ncbi:MAG: putative nucleic acid-binding protein [Halobacteriales archaeon]|jgi:predicted nucleic acid-binding protein
MTDFVADTSGLVSLGITAGNDPDPLGICLDEYDVLVPETVVDELREIGSHDDHHGRAAGAVLDRTDDLGVRSVSLDDDSPLDDGENAAVALANDVDAALFCCDEFNHLGLIHASLADTRLVTTPTVLSVLVRRDLLPAHEALDVLESVSRARNWTSNSYVQRARSLLESEASP